MYYHFWFCKMDTKCFQPSTVAVDFAFRWERHRQDGAIMQRRLTFQLELLPLPGGAEAGASASKSCSSWKNQGRSPIRCHYSIALAPGHLHFSPLLVPSRHQLPGRSQISANFGLPLGVFDAPLLTATVKLTPFFAKKNNAKNPRSHRNCRMDLWLLLKVQCG